MIGCRCKVCRSADKRDKRLRPSVLLSVGGRNLLVDTSPDLRQQMLRCGLERLDAILYTHAHADHILGLDDVRPFNFMQRDAIPVYGAPEVLAALQQTFAYVFDDAPSLSSRPRLELHAFGDEPFDAAGVAVTPVRLAHGDGFSHGFRIGASAYLTDHNGIPDASRERLRGLNVLFLDCLRHNPHPTHSTVNEALRLVETLAPKRAFLTHISHDLGHAATEAQLPAHIRLAYDGLEIAWN